MNSVRLVCGGQAVDLPTDFGILINKSIADIREPENRESDWTKTFTLPGTKANNKLFTHLFQLDLSIRNTSSSNFNPDFNPNLKAGAVLYVDEVSQIEGYIRLLSINVTDHGQIEYECTMHGQLADMFATIADGRLSDLDFSEYNHTLNITNITESWNTRIQKNGSNYVNFSGGAPIGEGYVYGWVDNGQYGNYSQLYTDESTLYLYAKTVVDKIFSGAGYFYSSGSFFNTDLFKRLVIPCPTRMPVLSDSDILNRQFEAKRTSSATYNYGDTVIFDAENFDTTGQYNTTTGEWTVGSTGNYNLTALINGSASGLTAGDFYDLVFDVNINGIGGWDKLRVLGGQVPGSGVYTWSARKGTEYNINLTAGDVVTFKYDGLVTYTFFGGGLFPVPVTNKPITIDTNSLLYNSVIDPSNGYGTTVQMDGFFPDDVKQRDFLKHLFTLFNLYVEPDPDNLRTLVVRPREEFYTSTVRDWTQKRDLSQPMTIIPMGELDAKRYLFTYAQGKDVGNEDYTRDFGRIYGDRRYEVNNQFVKDEKKIETGFAATLLNTFADKTFPYIETNQTNTAELRIMQFKNITCASYTIYHGLPGAFSGSTSATSYPYMGHLDDPLNSTSDINFGMPRQVSLPPNTPYTNNNVYNAYWSKYIQEITDKDSKIVRGHFHLSPADMERLSFRDLYYFDEQYFRLNKIEDYDPINPGVNICEFIFLKNGQTFTASTGSVGGGGERLEEYDPRGGGGNGKVIQSKGISVGYSNDIGDGISVGDNITNLGRANTALGSSGVFFLPGSERAVVVGKSPATPIGTDEVWVQGVQITTNNLTGNRITTVTTGNHTATLDEDIIIMKDTAACTVSLPAASTATNKVYHIKKFGNSVNAVTIDPNGSEKIDNATTKTMGGYLDSIMIVCDGVEWYTI